jgi:hypothetical protein
MPGGRLLPTFHQVEHSKRIEVVLQRPLIPCYPVEVRRYWGASLGMDSQCDHSATPGCAAL